MSLQTKALLLMIAGAASGALTWILTEVLRSPTDIGVLPHAPWEAALLSTLIGLSMGVVEAAVSDNAAQRRGAVGSGLLLGIGGGLGASLLGMFIPGSSFWAGSITGGLLLIAAMTGATQGLARRSGPLALQGSIGAIVGGLAGEAALQGAATLDGGPISSTVSRLIALSIASGLIGLGMGLAPDWRKKAWLRSLRTPHPGNEYPLASMVTRIGSGPQCEIYAGGVADIHAVIEYLPQERRRRLRHMARTGQKPTLLNESPMTSEKWLTHGDRLQIGDRIFVFLEPATQSLTQLPTPRTPEKSAGVIHPEENVYAAVAGDSAVTSMDLDMPALQAARQAYSGGVGPKSRGEIGSRLVCISGAYTGHTFPVQHDTVSIGRSSKNEIALPADTHISRVHARIEYTDGVHILSDVGASNGIYVNDALVVAPTTLSAGDVISLGETLLRYE
ncbi:MAG: FHA domain-containing protein [Capsulimonas sp.]|uniref:FHA domain-containing protein n=1 Tax=Capsulimonas sp. TaxID=2494211 RepID=UPI0032653498